MTSWSQVRCVSDWATGASQTGSQSYQILHSQSCQILSGKSVSDIVSFQNHNPQKESWFYWPNQAILMIIHNMFLWRNKTSIYPDTLKHEPPQNKTNKMVFAPSEDRSAWASAQSDQSLCCGHPPSLISLCCGHPPSLIRVFAVRMKKVWILIYPMNTQQRLIKLGQVLLGLHPFCWFCHALAHIVSCTASDKAFFQMKKYSSFS